MFKTSLNRRTKVYSGLIFYDNFPANTRHIAGLMLAHRLRRWTNIIPTLGQRFVFAGFDMVVITGVLYKRI